MNGQKIDLEPVTFLISLLSRQSCGTDICGHLSLIMPNLVWVQKENGTGLD